MYIHSNISANLLYVETETIPQVCRVADLEGREIVCPVLGTKPKGDGFTTILDASALETW